MTDTVEQESPHGDRIVVDFDQHSRDYRDRYPEISHELRSKCPVVWTESNGGHWVVTGSLVTADGGFTINGDAIVATS